MARDGMHSICEADFTLALACVPGPENRIGPACIRTCVADTDPQTPDRVDPECTVAEVPTGGEPREIPPCAVSGDTWRYPPETEVCFRLLTDHDQRTAEQIDDMSPLCSDEGWNAEIRMERMRRVPGEICVEYTCVASSQTPIDCPNL